MLRRLGRLTFILMTGMFVLCRTLTTRLVRIWFGVQVSVSCLLV